MYLEYAADGHWEVTTGLVSDLEGEEVVKFQGNMWIEDTRDGGITVWVPRLDGSACSRFARGAHDSEELPLEWKLASPVNCGGEDRLRGHCHCGAVKYYITRPDKSSLDARSPYPDLLVPFHSGASTKTDDAWWISRDQKRYVAGHCACNSCRQLSGFDIQQWAFVPLSNIRNSDGGPLEEEGLPGTKRYSSSPGVTRTFCSTCGANVFWESERRPTLVDVSVGLLDAESGARAEEWLEWVTGRVSFSEETHNKALTDALQAGLDEWKRMDM
jgi:hypothetical protein